MFNLEQAVTDWRGQMLAAGIKTPVPLDELESHLREDVEHQVDSGVSTQQAFDAAVRRIGQGGALKTEFGKVSKATTRKEMKQVTVILAGLFGVLIGFGMVWPQLGMLHRTGAVPHFQALLAGTGLVLAAGGVMLYALMRHRPARGRKLITICLLLVGGLCSAVNLSTFLELSASEWLWWPPVVAAVIVFFGGCLYLNRRLPQPAREA
jgi:hypothetical protein